MQQLKTAVAVFCIACVCAELVGQLLGDVWGRQCIKAAAGLYILVAFFHALPEIRAGILPFTSPDLPAASFGSVEETILLQAEASLSAQLEEQISHETGLTVSVAVDLWNYLPAQKRTASSAAPSKLCCAVNWISMIVPFTGPDRQKGDNTWHGRNSWLPGLNRPGESPKHLLWLSCWVWQPWY